LLKQQEYDNTASHFMEELPNNVKLVTIARNPVDSVSSHFVMTSFYNNLEQYQDIPVFLRDYAVYYNWFMDKADYVVSYDSLVQNPKATMEHLFDYFSMPYKEIDYDLTLDQDDASKKYLRTATGVSFYDKVRTIALESEDLPKAQEAYQKLLTFRGY
jgi:hypothetical protein